MNTFGKKDKNMNENDQMIDKSGISACIGIKTPDDKILTIYCTVNGYPESTGKTLLKHYNNEDKIMNLIKLGDISDLQETCESTVARFRDLHEPWSQCSHDTYLTKTDYMIGSECDGAEYAYMWDNGKWKVYEFDMYNCKRKFADLSDVLSQEQER